MSKQIEVHNLSKEFVIPKHQKGVLRRLFNNEYTTKEAVKDISFSIDKGELIGFIGPNGAGKSTTIKMLTGIMVPTGGSISVLGNDPYKKRMQNAAEIGVVFGQRTQLWWDLPVIDTFELLKKIYNIPDKDYTENLETFNEVLGIDSFWLRPVRQLSLGQRMRADIAAALLHNPKILFLDEPTIGLDVVVKKDIRTLIRSIRDTKGVTVVLTTHDMKDVDSICERVILIDNGTLMMDMPIVEMKQKLGKYKTVNVNFEGDVADMEIPGCETVKQDGFSWKINYDHDLIHTGDVLKFVTSHYSPLDISIQESDIEDIIRGIYTGDIKLA